MLKTSITFEPTVETSSCGQVFSQKSWEELLCRELTYPTLEKGKSSSKVSLKDFKRRHVTSQEGK